MFKERCESDGAKSKWTIYPGHKARAQVLLAYKKHYKYSMTGDEVLRVEIRDTKNAPVITKEYRAADVEEKSKKIIIVLSEEETNQLTPDNKYYFTAFFNGFVSIPAQLITVRKVVQ